MMKRYVLHPGPVVSRTDGQTHQISAPVLARLYGVPMGECVIARRDELGRENVGAWPPDPVHLSPRYDGNYRLPTRGNR